MRMEKTRTEEMRIEEKRTEEMRMEEKGTEEISSYHILMGVVRCAQSILLDSRDFAGLGSGRQQRQLN